MDQLDPFNAIPLFQSVTVDQPVAQAAGEYVLRTCEDAPLILAALGIEITS